MGVYDKAAVVEEVRRIQPDVAMIAVTGSAAFEGVHFQPDSDIDVIAIGSRNSFAWGEIGGRELEIRTYTRDTLNSSLQNPQWWHPTSNWIFVAGTIAGAEVLFGESVRDLVLSCTRDRNRLVAASALIGLLLGAESRRKTGRRVASLDVPLTLTALSNVVGGGLPIRAEPDDAFRFFSAESDISTAVKFASEFAERTRDILADDEQVASIMYLPEHRTGLRWLRSAIGINRGMPHLCLY